MWFFVSMIFLIVLVLGAIVYLIVINEEKGIVIKDKVTYNEVELKKAGYYKLNLFEKWIILKCENENKLICILCKITSAIFWILLALSALYTLYKFFF